jgi:diaminohydroxyphosphoribosylaminopyrimidine deaminase/5-amino-6-(5-phosphoribosylamino)uracil reductase
LTDHLPTSTLYVNLEPCNHHGKTPPCTDLILDCRIPRVVVGTVDTSPAVRGAGLARLSEGGVAVSVGVLEDRCRRLNEAFFLRSRTGRPLVTVKIAQTLDGFIAARTGTSRWISCETSRTLVHSWRAESDAVLVGSGAARADDPALTVRHVGGRQPWRIVLDRDGSLPASLRLFTDDEVHRTVIVHGPDARPVYGADARKRGARILPTDERDGHLDLLHLIEQLGRGWEGRALLSILVEAGPGLASALLRADLVDRLHIFVAPKLLGAGRRATDDLGIGRLDDALGFVEAEWETSGVDMLFTGYLRPA